MATYQKKYWFDYGTIDGKVNTVEIWQHTDDTLVAEEVQPMGEPFILEMPQLSHKFQPVRGTGCEINLLSTSDRKFFNGLYHTDMREMMIKHFIDGVLNWVGFANSEMVRESYSEAVNYPFQITGNDGFALLDRLQFVDEAGDHYTGIKSFFELVTICLNRIGLPFFELRIALSTTIPDFTIGAYSTLLHFMNVNCENFYNEDGDPETMRKVLESVLQPLGAYITQVGANVYITDVHTMATGGDIPWYCYDLLFGTYIKQLTRSETVDFSSIGYMGTGSTIEQSGGKNKQVISYSPYPIRTILPECMKDLSEFSSTPAADFSTRDSGAYYYKALSGHDKFTVYSPATFEQSYRDFGINVDKEHSSDASVCITWKSGTVGTKVLEMTVHPYLTMSKGLTIGESVYTGGTRLTSRGRYKGVGIKFSGEAEFYRWWTSGSSTRDGGVRSFKLKYILRVGGYSGTLGNNRTYSGAPGSLSNQWAAYPGSPQAYGYVTIAKDDFSNVCGVWMPFEVTAWNSIDLSGDVYLEFYSEIDYTDEYGKTWTNTNNQHEQVRIRKLAISLVDSETGKEIGDVDFEYVGLLDKKLKDEAEKINLICGTDKSFVDRGKIMFLSNSFYSSQRTFTRAGQTYCIEDLLLNSLSSNYRMGYITLSDLKLKTGWNHLNILTDTGLISNKKFMVTSFRTNYRDNVTDAATTEISPDSLTIVTDNG